MRPGKATRAARRQTARAEGLVADVIDVPCAARADHVVEEALKKCSGLISAEAVDVDH